MGILINTLIILVIIGDITGINAQSYSWMRSHTSIHMGMNLWAGALIAAIVVGTPLFFVVNFFITRYERKKKEEMELKEIRKNINNRRKNSPEKGGNANYTNGNNNRNSDYYGTSKMLKECINRANSVSQLFVVGAQASNSCTTPNGAGNMSPNLSHGSPLNQSSNSIQTTNSTNVSANQPPLPPQQLKNSDLYIPKTSSFGSSNSHNLVVIVNNQPSPRFGNGQLSTNSSPKSINRFNERMITPPSPILSTFGKGNEDSKTPEPPQSPTTNMKRTISADDSKRISEQISGPIVVASPLRPKSLTASTNESLLLLLSSNTVPKDHWYSIVYRSLELAMSFWLPPKYDGQASLTALTQIELSLSGFSEQEQLRKQVTTIDDQKYFSPTIFEIYGKLMTLHEFIRSKPSRVERDVHGVNGVFSILLPSLFSSFVKWCADTSDSEHSRYQITTKQENLIDVLSSDDIVDKNFLHKSAIHFLTDYIRYLLYYSIEKYNGSTLYKIVDLYHGIADDIDKLLFDDSYEDFEDLNLKHSKDGNNNDGTEGIENEKNRKNENGDACIEMNDPKSSFKDEENPFRLDNELNQECSLLNIITSIANRFSHIENYLEMPQMERGSFTGSLLTFQQQKSIITSCYNHLQTALSIFSATDSFSSKFKVDTIPVLKMMLATLSMMEEQMEAGVGVGDMSTGELLEWTSAFARIATSLNNAILKNSSILMASQIVDMSMSNGNLAINNGSNSSFTTNANTSTGNLRSSATMNKPPSSPFGSPALMSYLIANQGSVSSPQYNNQGGDSNHHPNTINIGLNSTFTLPTTRERCTQMVQLSQDSIMFSVMACFGICSQNTPSGDGSTTGIRGVSDHFNDNLGVFFSSIRTNIFCTYILLNPIYEMHG